MSDESTAVLQGQLERALTGDAAARQRLLELTRDRLMRHARRLLHGRYARVEPMEQTDDVVQQLYLKIIQQQDRFWVNARGEPVRTLAEFFGHTSARCGPFERTVPSRWRRRRRERAIPCPGRQRHLMSRGSRCPC